MYATHLYKAIIIRHYIWFFFRNVRHYICGLINSVLWRDHRTQAVCRAPGPGVTAMQLRDDTQHLSHLRKEENEFERTFLVGFAPLGSKRALRQQSSTAALLPGRGPLGRSARSISIARQSCALATASNRPHGTGAPPGRARCRCRRPCASPGPGNVGRFPGHARLQLRPGKCPCSRRPPRCSCLRLPAVVHGVVGLGLHVAVCAGRA